jgi:hypothetical protein
MKKEWLGKRLIIRPIYPITDRHKTIGAAGAAAAAAGVVAAIPGVAAVAGSSAIKGPFDEGYTAATSTTRIELPLYRTNERLIAG